MIAGAMMDEMLTRGRSEARVLLFGREPEAHLWPMIVAAARLAEAQATAIRGAPAPFRLLRPPGLPPVPSRTDLATHQLEHACTLFTYMPPAMQSRWDAALTWLAEGVYAARPVGFFVAAGRSAAGGHARSDLMQALVQTGKARTVGYERPCPSAFALSAEDASQYKLAVRLASLNELARGAEYDGAPPQLGDEPSPRHARAVAIEVTNRTAAAIGYGKRLALGGAASPTRARAIAEESRNRLAKRGGHLQRIRLGEPSSHERRAAISAAASEMGRRAKGKPRRPARPAVRNTAPLKPGEPRKRHLCRSCGGTFHTRPETLKCKHFVCKQYCGVCIGGPGCKGCG